MKKIGIMGGTFNPIHNGHLAIAKAAYEQFSLEKVLFLPSKKPPHKKNRKIEGNKERMDMVSLAILPYPFFVISKNEMEREGYSYTSDTLADLKKIYPDYELCFIVGADSLHYMAQWHKPEIVFSLSHVLCAPRYPNTKQEDYKCREQLLMKFKAKIDFIEMKPVNISSKKIVQSLQEGKEIQDQLPEEVYQYIKAHHLYCVS
ncbi:MAG: nicotinate-nucleotide adenylyltransferase [Velocimicrobium sp.]